MARRSVKGADRPKEGARVAHCNVKATTCTVSNGAGGRNSMADCMALGPGVHNSPTASARARDANRREVCAYMALGPKRGPRPVARDCAACVQAERADPPTKVGADALGPGPGRCGNDMLRALCRKMQRGTRHAANVMPENAARHSATQRSACRVG